MNLFLGKRKQRNLLVAMIAKKLNTVVAFVDCREGGREGLPG
jgi:hypothetical protein